LTLRYASSAVNDMKSQDARAAWVGVGWRLDLGAIRYVDNDHQYIDLNGVGDLLIPVGGTGYRTRHESFLRIDKLTDGGGKPFWRVKDKSGTVYEFGNTADSRQFNPEQDEFGQEHERYYRWDLNKVQSPDG